MRGLKLPELYAKLNREIWDGKLPKYSVYFFPVVHPEDGHPVAGRTIHEHRIIGIHPQADTGLTLIHEMMHVAVPHAGHSGEFWFEVTRVAQRLGLNGDEWTCTDENIRAWPQCTSPLPIHHSE